MNERSIFREAMGDTPVIRVLDFLIEGQELDYSLTDIAENSNVGWTTLHRIWDNLLRIEMVVFTRKVGKAKLFRLNRKSLAVKRLVEVYNALLLQETEKYLSRKTKTTSPRLTLFLDKKIVDSRKAKIASLSPTQRKRKKVNARA